MNFNFTPSLWANDGNKPMLRTLSAGGVIQQPRSSAEPSRPGQPSYGGFAALGASFIPRPATDLHPLPSSAAAQLLAPLAGLNSSGAPPLLQAPQSQHPASTFYAAYGLGGPAAVHGNGLSSGSTHAALQGGPLYAPYAHAGGAAGRDVGSSLDAFMAPYEAQARGMHAPYGQPALGQMGPDRPPRPPAMPARPERLPPAGIRYLASMDVRGGSLITGATGLTGAQEPPQRRAQAGSEQVCTAHAHAGVRHAQLPTPPASSMTRIRSSAMLPAFSLRRHACR